jgi:hypothetical protein
MSRAKGLIMSSDVHALPTTGCPVEPLEQLIQLHMICPPGDEPERIPSIYEMLAGAANEPPNVEPGVRPSDTLAGCRLRHVARWGAGAALFPGSHVLDGASRTPAGGSGERRVRSS